CPASSAKKAISATRELTSSALRPMTVVPRKPHAFGRRSQAAAAIGMVGTIQIAASVIGDKFQPSPAAAAVGRSAGTAGSTGYRLSGLAREPDGLDHGGKIVQTVNDDRRPDRIEPVTQKSKPHADRENLAEKEPVILHVHGGPGGG